MYYEQHSQNMSLTGEPPKALNRGQKLATVVGVAGLGILTLSLFNLNFPNRPIWLTVSLMAITLGIVWFAKAQYGNKLKGIKNDGVMFKSISSRGLWGWVSGVTCS